MSTMCKDTVFELTVKLAVVAAHKLECKLHSQYTRWPNKNEATSAWYATIRILLMQ